MKVIIDGVEYVPNPSIPVRVSFYYMHDNHTFTKLYGTTLDEVIRSANVVELSSSCGMLCPFHLLNTKDHTVKQGTIAVHSSYSYNPKDQWEEGIKLWKQEAENNEDVMRLILFNGAPVDSSTL